MGTTYEAAGPELKKAVQEAIKAYHPDLIKATIATVICRRYDRHETEINAMKTRGQTVMAKIAITPLADRARGLQDAKLTINGYQWDRMEENARKALLDHELCHLEIGEGADDLGRPKLKMRHHDWELTGFAAVVERHGENSVESKALQNFKADYGKQLNLFQ